MARDTPRLGRGLKSLISIPEVEPDPVASPGGIGPASGGVPLLRLDQIVPNPFQPRKNVDPRKLEELVRSIATSGVIQPIVVRRRGETFELVAGERRWQAAKRAGLESVPAVVREASDEEMLRLALIENIHREDLNAIDRAEAYRAYGERFGHTAEKMAEEFGEDRSTVSNYLRLLSLPEAVRQLVASGELGMGHARALLGLSDAEEQTNLALTAVTQTLSVRRVEELVRLRRDSKDTSEEGPKAGAKDKEKRPLVRDLEERLSTSMGTKVVIHEGRTKYTGRVVVEYYSLDDFDRITERLGLTGE